VHEQTNGFPGYNWSESVMGTTAAVLAAYHDKPFIYMTLDFFENEEEFMNEIRKSSHVKQYQKNAVISRQDEASETIYILLEGRIEANYIAEDGQKKIFSIFEPRIMFGESNLAGFPNLLNFVCLTPVKVAAIRKQDIYNWDKQMLFTIIHISCISQTIIPITSVLI
jgi:CRP-like cAMP-binding protein